MPWQTMQAPEARVQQHVGALVQDCEEALQAMETHRHQAGLNKVFR